MTTHDRFGGLRALLQKTPSEGVWEALRKELALWDDEARERVALPYVSAHLDRWPVEIARWADQEAPAWKQRLANAWTVRSAEEVRALMESGRAGRLMALEVRGDAVGALAPLVGQLARLVRVEVRADNERALAALLAARWPKSLRRVVFGTYSNRARMASRRVVEALAQNEALAGLEALEVEGLRLSDANARLLADSPHLRALRTLQLYWCGIGPAGARALADSPFLDTVERLDVRNNPLGMGLVALVSSPHTRALRTLDLDAVPISATCARALARASLPPALEELKLALDRLEDPVLGVLADWAGLRAVRALYLRPSAGARGAARLLGSPHLSGVRELSLRGELEGVWEVMCGNPALAGAEHLDVYCAGLEPAQLERLADSPMRPGLQALEMECAREVEVAVLGERATWPALCWLRLEGQERYDGPGHLPMLSDAGVERLSESGLLAGLHMLDLRGNALGDAAARALARSGQLGQVRRLNLANNQIGAAGLRALLEPGVLRDLEELCIAYNQIGDAGATALAHSPHMRAIKPYSPKGYSDGGFFRNQIGLAGVLALLRSPYLDPDQPLDLAGNPLTHEDIVALASEPDLARLRGPLWIVPNDAPAQTWQALLDSPYTNPPTRDNAAWNIEQLRNNQRRR